MIFKTTVDGVTPQMLRGFFVGWVNPPNIQTHYKMLENSSKIVIALDDQTNMVVGFISAISDGVLSAYIPFLEVLPEYKSRGIGKELVNRMLGELDEIYMIDLMCDEDLQSYYEKFEMIRSRGMIKRNYKMQSGKLL